MVIKELKKYLLLVAFLLLSKEAFALISREDLVEAASSVIPRGYFDTAAILGIPGPLGGLILFFITAALGLALFWIAINKIFANDLTNNPTLHKAATLISASLGLMLAYGIGMLAVAFYILLGISALVVMLFIGVATFRVARGFAAGAGKYEAELRKAELEVRSSLMKVEATYESFKKLSEKLFKGRRLPQYLWLGREESLFERLFKDIERLMVEVDRVIGSGDRNQIIRTLNEVRNRKGLVRSFKRYFENILQQPQQQQQQDVYTREWVNMIQTLIVELGALEKALNKLENELNDALQRLQQPPQPQQGQQAPLAAPRRARRQQQAPQPQPGAQPATRRQRSQRTGRQQRRRR